MALNRGAIFNDDYCDLQDGSDETETSACSYLKVEYRCTAVYSIPTSRINDGFYSCYNILSCSHLSRNALTVFYCTTVCSVNLIL